MLDQDLDQPATRRDVREGDAATRREIRAVDTALRDEIRALEASLREAIRTGDAAPGPMLRRCAVRSSIASTSRKSSLSDETVSSCQVRPPSAVRRIVLPLPLAHATVSLTALTPRSVAVPPLT